MRPARTMRYVGKAGRQVRPTGSPRRGLLLPPLLIAAMVAALVLAVPWSRTPSADTPPVPSPTTGAPRESADGGPRAALVPLDESAPAPTATPPPVGLSLATGGPPQPLRAAPNAASALLVQVPDNAALVDLGEMTPDGAWQRVAWEGWEGWIAAGVLRRRQ